MPVTRTQRTLLFCAITSILSEPVLANNEDIIARCATIATVGDRIVCLEDALRHAPQAAEALPAVTEAPAPSPTKPVTAANATVEITSGATVEVATAAPQVVESIGSEIAADKQRKESVASTATVPKELGAEQVAPGEDVGRNADRISARIVSFDVIGVGSLRFWLDNGQVWRQIGDDDQNIRRKIRKMEDIPVEMWKSRTGGYRMRIVSIDRTVRVKRLK